MSVLERNAQVVTFEIVNLDQLELDDDAPRTRVEIVLVEIPFRKTLEGGAFSSLEVRGYLLAGYSNDVGAFDEHLAAFRTLVKSIELAPD